MISLGQRLQRNTQVSGDKNQNPLGLKLNALARSVFNIYLYIYIYRIKEIILEKQSSSLIFIYS